jgi:hypothetical protein
VDNENRLAEEFEQIIGDFGEARLVGKKGRRKPVHPESICRDAAFRIEISLEGPPGRHVIDEFDHADFHDSMAASRIQAGRLRVENHLSHALFYMLRLVASRAPKV